MSQLFLNKVISFLEGKWISKSASGRELSSYKCDKNRNRIKEKDVVGNIKEIQYDICDKITDIIYNGKQEVSFSYYNNGLKKSVVNGRITQNYNYDPDYNLTELSVTNGDNILAHNTYNYDGNGNRTMKKGITNYKYNSIGQLTNVIYPTYNEMLFYDNIGNHNSRLVNGREEYYTYDPRNTLTDLMIDLRNTHHEYDDAGNLIKDGNASYEYNAFNQTTKVRPLMEMYRLISMMLRGYVMRWRKMIS